MNTEHYTLNTYLLYPDATDMGNLYPTLELYFRDMCSRHR